MVLYVDKNFLNFFPPKPDHLPDHYFFFFYFFSLKGNFGTNFDFFSLGKKKRYGLGSAFLGGCFLKRFASS